MDKSKLSVFEKGILSVLGQIYKLIRPALVELANETNSDVLKKIIAIADALFGDE